MRISNALRERLLISADDYGVRQTTGPILQLARAGKIDRVAVMVNYVSEEEARLLLATSVKIDIHLEIIELLGRGATAGDATLSRGLSFIFRFLLGYIQKRKVREEWKKQIEKFRILFGRLPDGLNSHEHVHYFPLFFTVFVEFANTYQIPFVRFGKAGLLLHLQYSIIGYILSVLHLFDKRKFLSVRSETTDYLVDLNWLKSFGHLMRSMPQNGKVEFVVHPERLDEYEFIDETF